MFQLTPIVKKILIVNVAIALIGYLIPFSLDQLFGLHSMFSDNFYIFQYFTYMWLHGGFYHLLFNMFGVLVFGPMLERVWGSKRFLIYYFVTGVGASVLYGAIDGVQQYDVYNDTENFIGNPNPEAFNKYIFEHGRIETNSGKKFVLTNLGEFSDQYFENPNSSEYNSKAVILTERIRGFKNNMGVMVGASGALFGILIAFGMLFPNTELMLLFPPIPVKAKYLVFFYGAYAMYNLIHSRPGDNVAHLAHLTGMLAGYLMLKYWQKQRGDFY